MSPDTERALTYALFGAAGAFAIMTAAAMLGFAGPSAASYRLADDLGPMFAVEHLAEIEELSAKRVLSRATP